jgi:aminomethyltransferase
MMINAFFESAALFELSGRGRIKAAGEDRKRLLHAMTTNHVQELAPGHGCYAFFLSAQGRIQSDVTILAQEDSLLLDVEPAQREKVFAHLDKFIIADDVTLEDVSDSQTTLALEGPHAARILEAIGAPIPERDYDSAPWAGRLVVRTSYSGAPGFHIYLSPLDAPVVKESLLDAGAREVDADTVETARILNGRPLYGVDIVDTTLPQETRLSHALHFNKGCYLGQEIVERIRSRGHVNKLLERVEIDGEPTPETGTVTSRTVDPRTGRTVVLTYRRPS